MGYVMLANRPRPTLPPRRTSLRRLLPIFILVLVAIVLGQHLRTEPAGRTLVPQAAPATSAAPSPSPVHSTAAAAGVSGRFTYVSGVGPVLGARGPIRRFKVAVERPVRASVAVDFADEVDRTLGNRRSWVGARQFRLQRVPQRAYAEFTVYLTSARTSQRMCRTGGLETAGYTSCRLPGQVIINDTRWRTGVPRYGASLIVYRQYAINHEVGTSSGTVTRRAPGAAGRLR
ncbi:MAG: DUF3152 domain-containing protein [Actinoplanes sp.]